MNERPPRAQEISPAQEIFSADFVKQRRSEFARTKKALKAEIENHPTKEGGQYEQLKIRLAQEEQRHKEFNREVAQQKKGSSPAAVAGLVVDPSSPEAETAFGDVEGNAADSGLAEDLELVGEHGDPEELPFDEDELAAINEVIAESNEKRNILKDDASDELNWQQQEETNAQLRKIGREIADIKTELSRLTNKESAESQRLEERLEDARERQTKLNEQFFALGNRDSSQGADSGDAYESDDVSGDMVQQTSGEKSNRGPAGRTFPNIVFEPAPDLPEVVIDAKEEVAESTDIPINPAHETSRDITSMPQKAARARTREVSGNDSKELETKNPEAEQKPKRRRVTIVSAQGAKETAARDIADRRMTASRVETRGPRLFRGEDRTSKEQLQGFTNVFKNIWKHNLFREYYRQKELEKAREEIITDGSERHFRTTAMATMVERFTQEYDDVIHEGESRQLLAETEGIVGLENQDIKNDIRTLVTTYAQGLIDENVFRQERSRLLSGIHGVSEDVINEGVEYGDNLLEIARQIKLSVEHGEGLNNLDLEFDVVVGQARAGVRTEAQLGAVDRTINRIQNTTVGRFFNETTVASGVAIAYSLGAFVSERFARSKLLAWGSFGATAVLGAGIAGGRESLKLEEERRQHAREVAQGRIFKSEEAPRRNEMQEHIHDMRSARELAGQLENSLYTITPDGVREVKDLSAEDLRLVLAQIAAIESRITLSDRHNIDLLAYSSDGSVEEERLRLDIVRAQAKVDIRKRFGDQEISNGKNSEDFLKELTGAEVTRLWYGDEGVEKKNDLFKRMKNKKVAAAALKGLATGLVVGGALQEAGAFFKKDQLGFFERLFRGNKVAMGATRLTPLEYIRGLFDDSLPANVSAMHEVGVGPGTISLPEGYELTQETNGSFSIRRDGDVVSEYVGFNPDGSLTDLSEQQLSKKGFVINSSIEHLMHETPGLQTPAEFVEKTQGDMVDVDRSLWYDNDTPKPLFDKNELRLWWGGEGNTGIDKETGEYVFSVARMTEDGSYHSTFSADARKLMKAGKLKLLLSVSQDTQGSVFEIPIDTKGNARIDSDSQIGKLLFRGTTGKAEFLGRYAEVAEILTSDENTANQVRVLATHVGEGVDAIPTLVQTPEEHIKTILDIPADRHLDPPLVIPILGRRPLEPVTENKKRDIDPVPDYFGGYGYYEGGISSLEEQKRLREEFSESLKKNPNENLDVKKEINSYLGRQSKGHIEQIRALADSVEPMTPRCRLSICIPVAGHQEGKNIYKTLSNYLNQTADKESFEIVLFVNHPDRDREGNPVSPDTSISEIQRFKKNHPELSVRMMYSVIPFENAKIGNIRKILNDAVLKRSLERGGDMNDVIIVSNDADNKGVVPEYVSNYIDKFEGNPKVDAFLGQLDWDHETYVKNPLVHVGTRFFQYLSIQARRRDGRNIESSGANFAFRSSIYAAVNGYKANSSLGEDVELGKKIKVARMGVVGRVPVAYGGSRVSRIYTSARRAEATVAAGGSPIEQWNGGFGAFDALRTTDFKGSEYDFDDVAGRELFVRDVEDILNRSIAAVNSWSAYDINVRRALGWLGIKYNIKQGGLVKITDASRLIEGLKEYKNDALPALERRLSK